MASGFGGLGGFGLTVQVQGLVFLGSGCLALRKGGNLQVLGSLLFWSASEVCVSSLGFWVLPNVGT